MGSRSSRFLPKYAFTLTVKSESTHRVFKRIQLPECLRYVEKRESSLASRVGINTLAWTYYWTSQKRGGALKRSQAPRCDQGKLEECFTTYAKNCVANEVGAFSLGKCTLYFRIKAASEYKSYAKWASGPPLCMRNGLRMPHYGGDVSEMGFGPPTTGGM